MNLRVSYMNTIYFFFWAVVPITWWYFMGLLPHFKGVVLIINQGFMDCCSMYICSSTNICDTKKCLDIII